MKNIKQIDIKNRRVLIRVDFNVPIKNKKIQSDFRIKTVKETINHCIKNNVSIVLMSHLGRPENKDPLLSLFLLKDYLADFFGVKVYFSDDCISDKAIKKSLNLKPTEIHLLENLRYYPEENSNNDAFAQKLSLHGDVYINDAFGTSHREHASNSSILKYFKIKAIGFLMMRELNYLDNIFNTESKGIVVLGGSKISTKIKMLKNFINKSSHILIGGAMAFTFLKSKGINVGKSLVEDDMINEASKILKMANEKNVEIILPVDVVCSEEYSNLSEFRVCNVNEINNEEMALDIGPETTMIFEMIIKSSKFIIWNGPLGTFELSNFSTGTHSIAYCISKLTMEKDVVSIIGGGDTASAVILSNLEDTYTHVSTGGGASLQLLSGEILKIISSWRKYER